MAKLLQTLERHIDPDTIDTMSRQLGTTPDQTNQAVATLLPLLIGGLSRNTHQSVEQKQRLNQALERDHDGSLLGQLSNLAGSFLGNSPSSAGGGQAGGLAGALGGLLSGGAGGTPGNVPGRALQADSILRHIFGNQRQQVETGVGRATGMPGDKIHQLLAMLAPTVMQALGRVKREENLDADGVTRLLDEERSEIEKQAPDTQPGGLLKLLDSNRDGKVDMSDGIAKAGMALGAAFLMSRRRR
jgi:hypothetical protein